MLGRLFAVALVAGDLKHGPKRTQEGNTTMPVICPHCNSVLETLKNTTFDPQCRFCGKIWIVSKQAYKDREEAQTPIAYVIGSLISAAIFLVGGQLLQVNIWIALLIGIPAGLFIVIAVTSIRDRIRYGREEPKGLSLRDRS
jgi:hypothetical protein